jgi:hypothetical protein
MKDQHVRATLKVSQNFPEIQQETNFKHSNFICDILVASFLILRIHSSLMYTIDAVCDVRNYWTQKGILKTFFRGIIYSLPEIQCIRLDVSAKIIEHFVHYSCPEWTGTFIISYCRLFHMKLFKTMLEGKELYFCTVPNYSSMD